MRFSHREPEFPTIASQHRFERRKRLLETTNQPPIAILVEHYPISWRYVNLGELFTRDWKFSLLRWFGGDKLLAMGSGVRRRSRENANDVESDPRTTLHKMIVEGLSMPAALKEKLKPILAPKG